MNPRILGCYFKPEKFTLDDHLHLQHAWNWVANSFFAKGLKMKCKIIIIRGAIKITKSSIWQWEINFLRGIARAVSLEGAMKWEILTLPHLSIKSDKQRHRLSKFEGGGGLGLGQRYCYARSFKKGLSDITGSSQWHHGEEPSVLLSIEAGSWECKERVPRNSGKDRILWFRANLGKDGSWPVVKVVSHQTPIVSCFWNSLLGESLQILQIYIPYALEEPEVTNLTLGLWSHTET